MRTDPATAAAASPALLGDADVLLVLCVVLAAGGLGGGLAKRAGLPRVTGQIVTGILLGPGALHLFPETALHALEPMTAFALALMTMSVGSHLEFARLRGAGARLGWLLACETLVTPLVVFASLTYLAGAPPVLAALFGALAVSTAPATVVALVKETRAKGIFVKTLVAAVALNNIACIVLYEAARLEAHRLLRPADSPALHMVLLSPLAKVFAAAAIGVVCARVLDWKVRDTPDRVARTSATLVALLAAAGVSGYVGASPLLGALFLGVAEVNLGGHRRGVGDEVFRDFESAILCAFFTLAGLHLDFSYVAKAGGLAVAFTAARLVGKVVAAQVAMRAAGAPAALRDYLGLALVPQAGVAIGLLLMTQDDPVLKPVAELVLAAGVTSVALNEIVGPVLTRLGLQRSGEAGQDRGRLIEFLGEESLTVGCGGADLAAVVDDLSRVLYSGHHPPMPREDFVAGVLARHRDESCFLGKGLAVPHLRLAGGEGLYGVMGLSREGFPLGDGSDERVHCVVLLGTGPDSGKRHLEALAALGRFVEDEALREDLYHSRSPAQAVALLQGEEFEEFNYFLEEMDHV